MKEKKGFTLVELLAVIAILAVILLISVPMILGVIEKSKEDSFRDSVRSVFHAIELYNLSTGIRSGNISDLEMSGSQLKGRWIIDENGEIILHNVTNGNYSIVALKGADQANEFELSKAGTVELIEYKEAILNGTYPVLKEGLIPVTITNDGTVKKADLYEEWYSYKKKIWANAVILMDKTKTYSVGETIPEANIESYFVWIPKYQYKLWNYYNKTQYNLSAYNYNDPEVLAYTNNSEAKTIEIKFTTENTTDVAGESCKTPTISSQRGACNNGLWMTHPAFLSPGVNGIWVGKFETGYNGATNETEARMNEADSTKIIVKPNVYSWRNNTAYNMFMSAYNYNQSLGSHMMKNTEWAATAYLSHSKYGINREVNINNNNAYKTGYSSLPTLDQSKFRGKFGDGAEFNQPYNTEIGFLASTTGNISGVYDMSGGAHEYMAAYIDENLGDSGFTLEEIRKEEYVKYLDEYYKTTKNMLYRLLGDATNEIAPLFYYKDGDGNGRYHNNWYGDQSSFIDSTRTWFTRGGVYDNGVLAGQFNFSRSNGAATYTIGSRLVLTP